jgi:hypothetical protein
MSMGSKPLAHKFVRLLNVRLNLKAPWPLNSLARISAAGGTPWLPDSAEVIWINHNPQAGREMKDHHPFLCSHQPCTTSVLAVLTLTTINYLS